MQVDAVHVGGGQQTPGGRGNGQPNNGKGGKGKGRKGGKGKEKEKQAGRFEGECRYCKQKGHKKAECRKMQADLAAGRCDKSGKAVGVNALTTSGGGNQPPMQASFAPSAVASLASTFSMQQMSLYTSRVPSAASSCSSPRPGSSTR